MQQNKPLSGLTIGYVGLGNMGRPAAQHLHRAGADIVVWNRSPGPALQAEQSGLRRAADLTQLAELVGDGIVCLNLTTTDVVREVVFGQHGLSGSLAERALVIDFGTTDVAATRQFAARRPWLDAPVSGGQVGAQQASLTIMVGGSDQDFTRALPVLTTVGKQVTHMGPSGAGQVTKLANQLIVAQTIDAVAQALRLAELAGVDPAKVRQALSGGFAESRILQLHGDRMVRRDFAPGGRAALQLKDVRLICQLAELIGFHSPTLDNCRSQWEAMIQQGLGDLDHSGLFRLYEQAPPTPPASE